MHPGTRLPGWRRRCHHWRFGVKVHTVQRTKLPRPHSRGVHRLLGFIATIATASVSSLSQITYPALSSCGPTAVLPRGLVCKPTFRKYPWSINWPLLIDYSNNSLYVNFSSLLCHRWTSSSNRCDHIQWCGCWPQHLLMMIMLIRTLPMVLTQYWPNLLWALLPNLHSVHIVT